MRDYLEFASTPSNEPCVQVGSENYTRNSRIECQALIAQIRRQIGQEPNGARLYTKSNPHDFGNYYEVAVDFDDDSEEQTKYAFLVDKQFPDNWDDQALEFLTENRYPFELAM